MRFLGLTFFVMAASAAFSAAPATAHEWYARPTPLIPENKQRDPQCYISSNDTLPHLVFSFEKDRTRFGVAADEFTSLEGVHEYRGTLPSGDSFTISLGTDLSLKVAALTFSSRDGGLQLLQQFVTAGDFLLTGNGLAIKITGLPSAAGELEKLHNCLKQLDGD